MIHLKHKRANMNGNSQSLNMNETQLSSFAAHDHDPWVHLQTRYPAILNSGFVVNLCTWQALHKARAHTSSHKDGLELKPCSPRHMRTRDLQSVHTVTVTVTVTGNLLNTKVLTLVSRARQLSQPVHCAGITKRQLKAQEDTSIKSFCGVVSRPWTLGPHI
jgi:hypothetical protein